MSVRARLATALLVPVLLLAGCTGDESSTSDQDTTATSESDDGEQAEGEPGGEASEGGPGDPGTAWVADQVMAEQSIGTPNGLGGDLQVTLRSVEVAEQNMTVRWALRWEAPEKSANATVSYATMKSSPAMTVTDRANLVAYRPYCTEGAWQPEGSGEEDVPLSQLSQIGQAQQRCEQSMLVSPPAGASFSFPNHGTIEAWAVLPAPEGRPEVVDVAPAEGLPMFTDATVTYTDGDQG